MGLFELELTMAKRELAATKEKNEQLQKKLEQLQRGLQTTIQNLIKFGYSLEKISEITELSETELTEILAEHYVGAQTAERF